MIPAKAGIQWKITIYSQTLVWSPALCFQEAAWVFCDNLGGNHDKKKLNMSETADYAPVPPPGELDQTALSIVRLLTPHGELDETL